MYRVGYDYSILVAARLAVEESDEYQEFKALNDQELNDGLSNANFEIQYISSLDKFYLVTSSEFIVPDVNNPIILEDLVAEVNQKSITYSVYLRPLEDGLHLILALSKVKMPHDAPGELPSRRNTRII